MTVSFFWEEGSVSLPGNTSKSYTTVKNSPTYGSTQSSFLYVTLRHSEMATSHSYTYKCSVVFHESNNTAHKFAKVTVKGTYLCLSKTFVQRKLLYKCACSVMLSMFDTSYFFFIPFSGHDSPNQPLLGGVKVFATKAEISFTVTSVAYTPEKYSVMFGTSSEQANWLSGNSTFTNTSGLTFLTDTNLSYTIILEDLKSAQLYYYCVVAMNTINTTKSETNVFITLEPSKISKVAYRQAEPHKAYSHFNNMC